jgi:hypothetical protein
MCCEHTLSPSRRRDEIKTLQFVHGVSKRRALRVFAWPPSSYRYDSCTKHQTALRMRLQDLALTRPRYGYCRMTVLLRRRGRGVSYRRLPHLPQRGPSGAREAPHNAREPEAHPPVAGAPAPRALVRGLRGGPSVCRPVPQTAHGDRCPQLRMQGAQGGQQSTHTGDDPGAGCGDGRPSVPTSLRHRPHG